MPSEIMNRIMNLGNLSVKSLKSLRLTCKKILPVATARLFDTVILLPKANSILKMRNVFLDQGGLKDHVRRVIYCIGEGQHYDPPVFVEDFLPAHKQKIVNILLKESLRLPGLRAANKDLMLFKFPNITSAEVQFDSLPPVEASWWDDAFDSEDEDQFHLEDALCSAQHEMDKILKTCYRSVAHLKSLTVVNLPNYTLHFTHDPKSKFNKILQGLDELHISVDTMVDTQRQIANSRAGFLGHLMSDWIGPCATNLTSLSLHMKGYWGMYLTDNIVDLKLPKLRKLCLWNWYALQSIV